MLCHSYKYEARIEAASPRVIDLRRLLQFSDLQSVSISLGKPFLFMCITSLPASLLL